MTPSSPVSRAARRWSGLETVPTSRAMEMPALFASRPGRVPKYAGMVVWEIEDGFLEEIHWHSVGAFMCKCLSLERTKWAELAESIRLWLAWRERRKPCKRKSRPWASAKNPKGIQGVVNLKIRGEQCIYALYAQPCSAGMPRPVGVLTCGVCLFEHYG